MNGDQRVKRFECWNGSLEADGAWWQIVSTRRRSDDRSDQMVGQDGRIAVKNSKLLVRGGEDHNEHEANVYHFNSIQRG